MRCSIVLEDGVISIQVGITAKGSKSSSLMLGPVDGIRRRAVDWVLLRVLVKAYIWSQEIERGRYRNSIALAKSLEVTHSYVAMVLRLNYFDTSQYDGCADGVLL